MEARIKIHYNIDNEKFDWADYSYEFETISCESAYDLKEFLYDNGVGRLSLKYIDSNSKTSKLEANNIDAEFFFDYHFEWLNSFDWGKQKYLEITGLDKRCQFGIAS